jgi:hypothetical protein
MLNPNSSIDSADIPDDQLPIISSQISVFASAVATFYAPSDLSGKHGMLSERIRCCKKWRGEFPRKDCIFAEKDPDLPGFRGLYVARVHLFFSFKYRDIVYPCALIHWFSTIGNGPCSDTGMWMVEPEFGMRDQRVFGVIHIDSIVRSAHLIPVYGDHYIPGPKEVNPSNVLDIFQSYYVNKFADHHSFEIAF